MSMPWRDRHFSPEGKFPRCVAYVKKMGVRTNDPGLTDYWLACLAAEAFEDDELVAAGTVDFNTMRGPDLLSALEKLMAKRPTRRASISYDVMDSLKAFLGSRRIKVSALKSEDDYWHAAQILWPKRIRRSDGARLSSLRDQIKSMTKKERQGARQNLAQLPIKWRGAA